jgi:protein SCO1
MGNNRLKKWAAFAALILLPALGIYFIAKAQWVHELLKYYSAAYTGNDKSQVEPIGDIVLFNQHGAKVTMADLRGKIVLANIFFATCPQVCPEMNKQIQSVAELFVENPDVQFITVTIDPERDSIAQLKKVAAYFNADVYHRQFCTGNKGEIYDWAINDLMLAAQASPTDDFIHDDKVTIIDKDGYIRGILPTRAETKTDRLALIKRIQDDIDNLIYEYRKKELDKR